MMNENLKVVQINHKIYHVGKQLGEGGYGKIYEAYAPSSKQFIALKISFEKTHLFQEFNMYKYLHQDSVAQTKGIPQVFDYQEDKEKAILEMQLLGSSLQSIMDQSKSIMDLGSILILGCKMLNIIEYIHSRGVLHRDLSPQNFLFGLSENSTKLYLIDFGLSKKYLLENGDHIPFNSSVSFVGNTRFASKNATARLEYCRREEIVSLCYILIYLGKGSLPWDDFEIEDRKAFYYWLAMKKANISDEELYYGIDDNFSEILKKVLNDSYYLLFAEKPNYDLIKKKISDLYKELKKVDIKNIDEK